MTTFVDTPEYIGPERRHWQRRTKGERRELMRFEPGKDNRRVITGRRKHEVMWDRAHSL